MATRSKKAAPAPRKPAKPERKPKAVAVAAEEKPGLPVEAVISIVTGLMLLGALFTMDYANGKNYGGGWFFKGAYEKAQ